MSPHLECFAHAWAVQPNTALAVIRGAATAPDTVSRCTAKMRGDKVDVSHAVCAIMLRQSELSHSTLCRVAPETLLWARALRLTGSQTLR